MTGYELDNWWCGLTIKQKNHIATKVKGEEINYPECTAVWEELDDIRKDKIYDHCYKDHNFVREQWQEGDSFSY